MSTQIGELELYLGLALIIGFVVCWGTVWLAMRDRVEVLNLLIDRGNLLRIVTVIFIVVSVGYLAVINRLSAEAATVMAGIAGYVLGGIQRSRD